MRLFEILNSKLPIKWETKKHDYWYGTFNIANLKYSIIFELHNGDYMYDNNTIDIWELSFALENNYFSGSKVIGTNNNQLKIFSTVINAMKDFLTSVKPEYFQLSASKENKNRFNLYTKFALKFKERLESLGYNQIEPPIYKHDETLLIKYFDTLAFRRVR